MNIYTIGQFAKIVHKSVDTIKRWDRKGVLIAMRTITNRRYYTDEHVELVLQKVKNSENITK